MIQFFSPEIVNSLKLPDSESSHCCRVLRMKKGDEIYVTDGKGNRFLCEISKPDPFGTEVIIKEQFSFKPEHNYKLTLAVAPTKNSDRLEWLIEKSVEIGIDSFVLLRCSRSERKVQRIDRLSKIMISAMKQSLSTFLPDLVEISNYEKFINEVDVNAQKFIGYCSDQYEKKDFVKECKPGGEVIILIGPEGDFTYEEVENAVKNGFMPVTFGNKRLRTETAGVFAVSAVNIINQLYD